MTETEGRPMKKDKALVSQSLMAMDALRKILEVTEITGLAYDPNYKWVLAVEKRAANGEPQEWTASCLEHVLRNAADDLAKQREAEK